MRTAGPTSTAAARHCAARVRTPSAPAHALLRKLEGGDLRSTGRAAEVVREVLARPALARVLVDGMGSADAVVRMRCADALEKVTAARPDVARRYRAALLPMLVAPQPREVLWHLLQIAPRVRWPAHELRAVHAAVARAHDDASSIVRACALQAEVELLAQSPARAAQVARLVRAALAAPVAAVRARARRLSVLLRASRPAGVRTPARVSRAAG